MSDLFANQAGLFASEPDLFRTGPGAVRFVDAAFHKATSANSPVVPLPALALPADVLVAHYCSRGQTDFTPPPGWFSVVEVDQPGTFNAVTIHLFWTVYDPTSSPGPWTGSVTTSRAYGTGVIALRGADQSNPIDSYATTRSVDSSTVPYGSVSVAHDNSLVVGAVSAVGTSTTEPTGTDERWDLGSGSGSQAAGDGWTQVVNAGATPSYAGAIDGSIYAAVLAAIRPAG